MMDELKLRLTKYYASSYERARQYVGIKTPNDRDIPCWNEAVEQVANIYRMAQKRRQDRLESCYHLNIINNDSMFVIEQLIMGTHHDAEGNEIVLDKNQMFEADMVVMGLITEQQYERFTELRDRWLDMIDDMDLTYRLNDELLRLIDRIDDGSDTTYIPICNLIKNGICNSPTELLHISGLLERDLQEYEQEENAA